MFDNYKARKFLTKSLDVVILSKLFSVLTYDGIKPSSVLVYQGDKDLNFWFKKYNINAELKYYNTSGVFFIGKNETYNNLVKDYFEKLIGVKETNESLNEIYYNLGSALGYPESAIMAFLYNKKVFIKDCSKELRRLMVFYNSKEKFQDELLTAKVWQKHLIWHYPLLYLKFKNDCKK